MPHPDGCPTITELHSRYDGVIPKDLREAANAGGYLVLAKNKAWSRVKFWHQYLRTNRMIRRHHIEMNAITGFAPNLLQEEKNAFDLAYALKHLHRFRMELRMIRAEIRLGEMG